MLIGLGRQPEPVNVVGAHEGQGDDLDEARLSNRVENRPA